MADPVVVIPVGSIEYLTVPVQVSGSEVELGVELSVVPAGQPAGTWAPATMLDGITGVLINGNSLAPGSYWVWARITANPEKPVVRAGVFLISSSAGWSYSPPAGGVFGDQVSELRFLARDTQLTSASLSDDEVKYLVTKWVGEHAASEDVNLYRVASWMAHAMADSYVSSAKVSKTVGDTQISREYGGEAERYRALADRLGAEAGDGVVGGVARNLYGFGLASPEQPSIFAVGHLDSYGQRGGFYGR